MRSRPPHVSPAAGCTCAACRAARLERWKSLSDAQRRALLGLDRKIPRHPADMKRDGIQWATLRTLLRERRTAPALAFTIDLRGMLMTSRVHQFILLTDDGLDHVREAARLEKRA